MKRISYDNKRSIIIKIVTIVLSTIFSLLAISLNYSWIVGGAFVPFYGILIFCCLFGFILYIILKSDSLPVLIYLLLIAIFTISFTIFLAFQTDRFVGNVTITTYIFGLLKLEPREYILRYIAQEDVGKKYWVFLSKFAPFSISFYIFHS